VKTIVISGSSKLQEEVKYWKSYFENNGYKVLDYPKQITQNNYVDELTKVYKEFYSNIEKTDVFFLMNEGKDGIKGYIGASGVAELTYAVIQNLIHSRNIKIYILNMPDEKLNCYDEVKFWLDNGWIEIYV